MIGFLKGRVAEMHPEGLILDVNGVGYDVHCSTNTLDACSAGEETSLQVHTHLREDALILFGFASRFEKNLFLALVKVNGVGPKLALKALSSGPLSNLVDMIESGDVKGLSSLPKIGKKTAEQIVLSLRGKLVLEEVAEYASLPRERSRNTRGEIISALVNLGFRLQAVEQAVDALPQEVDLQEGIRKGLQSLSRNF